MSFITYYFRAVAIPATATFPGLVIEVAFASDPTDPAPVWTDVSEFVRSLSVRRGRPNELARIEAGTLTLTLDNNNREFDPVHTGSPFYPNVLPLRRVRIVAEYGSLNYAVFHGYIERWPRARAAATTSAVTATAIDALAVLAQMNIQGDLVAEPEEGGPITEPLPAEFSGARVNRILDMVSWPAADRFIDAGLSEIAETTIEPPGVPALQHLQEVATSENGLLFASADGKVTFHDRHRRIRHGATSLASFSDFGDSPELPYTDLVPTLDLDEVFNHATVATPGGTVGEAEDSTSQTSFFKRSLPVTTLLNSAVEAEDAAAYYVGRHKDPVQRYDTMTLEPRMALTMWPQVLGRGISDRVTVTEHPPGGGTENEDDYFIEGVSHEVGPLAWTTTWQLSPASSAATWILEHPTLGSINGPGRLTY